MSAPLQTSHLCYENLTEGYLQEDETNHIKFRFSSKVVQELMLQGAYLVIQSFDAKL